MSEWIRHRGSKSMPKCLEGKEFEVRYRDGNAATIRFSGSLYWIHLGIESDIMAFRILSDINPPDYSKVFAVSATAESIGTKVGEEVGIPEPAQLVDDEQDAVVPTNKYQRTIKGVTVDVYDVLAAFGVTCQARGHAIKKLLMAGQRGHKDEAQDLREAVQAIERSIELVSK